MIVRQSNISTPPHLLLLHLQRHSDHHVVAKGRYQVLQHFEDNPQRPNGYAGMIVLALIPPPWRRVMPPRSGPTVPARGTS